MRIGFFGESDAPSSTDNVRVHASTSIRAAAPGIVLAAMGPRMIELAGTRADGTLTWMSGPEAVRGAAGRLRDAAAEARRSAPRVAVVGSEVEVDAHLDRFVAAGMTELCANTVGSLEDTARTMAHLARRRRSS